MKAGDRIKTKKGLKYEITGTIKNVVSNDEIWISLDSPIPGSKTQEGYVTKDYFDQLFDVIEESDWTSLWDDAAD